MNINIVILIGLLAISAIIVPLQYVVAQTDENKSDENDGLSLSEVKEFGSGVMVMSSSTTHPIHIIKMKLSSLSATDITNLGQSVSEVAKMHKDLAHLSKDEKKDFQYWFHEYRNAVKEILGIGQDTAQKLLQQDLQKSEIKIKAQLDKIKEEEDRDNKIKTSPQLTKQKDDLQKIKNKIGILNNFRYNGADKEESLSELQAEENKLLKKTMIQEAKQNGKKLTEDDLKKIEQEAEEKTSTSSNSGGGNGGDKGNSSKGSDSSGKGSSDKGNSGKSDKGNSGNSNKGGKGNSKK